MNINKLNLKIKKLSTNKKSSNLKLNKLNMKKKVINKIKKQNQNLQNKNNRLIQSTKSQSRKQRWKFNTYKKKSIHSIINNKHSQSKMKGELMIIMNKPIKSLSRKKLFSPIIKPHQKLKINKLNINNLSIKKNQSRSLKRDNNPIIMRRKMNNSPI